MGIRVNRKIINLGSGGRGITLPAGWLAYLGDEVQRVTVIGSDLLIVAPPGLEEKAERIAAYLESSNEKPAKEEAK